MFKSVAKPIRRGPLRMWLGKRYFICRRYWQWYFGKQAFAKTLLENQLEHQLFEHQTPLLRKLKNLEMQLQYNKITNLQLAAAKISGLIIRPGETFSFWYLVGRTSRSKGYKPGMMLQNGQIIEGIGGGLCQMSNLLFWMAIHTPLTITERWRHSYDVFPDAGRTQPFGSGATLSYNYVDLQFKNETNDDYQLNLWLSDTHLHGSICSNAACPYSYQVEETQHEIIGEAWGGYSRHNQIVRNIFSRDTQELIKTEPLVENHAILMYTPFLE